jgi:DNA-binding transcriptional ArsR family regulator
MSGRWFRFYDDAVHDPKVQCLPPELFKFWVNMLCVCSKFGTSIPTIQHLSYSLRMQERKVDRLLATLFEAGLIDRVDQGFAPHNWNVRQYKSDVSTERVKRFRERSSNVKETPSESDTESDTDTEKKKDKIPRQARKTKLPEDWQATEELLAYAAEHGCPDPKDTAERFMLHHRSKGTLAVDWDLSFKYWCRNEKNFARSQNGAHGAQKNGAARTVTDDGSEWSARLSRYKRGGFWSPMWGERPEDIPEGRTPTHIPAPVLAAWRASA